MKWINFKTTKGNSLTVKEDDIALILIDLSTGEGTLRLNNSCFTYDIIDNGVTEFLCGMSVARPLPDYDPEILRSEIQDLKLENDRLSKRNDKMWYALRAIACVPDCDFCMLRGSTCDEYAIKDLALRILTELEEL